MNAVDWQGRIGKAQARLGSHQLAAALVTSPAAQFYFTGVWLETGERASALLIPATGQVTWIVHEMFHHEVAATAVAKRLWQDGDNPYQVLASLLPATAQIAVDGQWPARHLLALVATRPQAPVPVLADAIVDYLRERKDLAEVSILVESSHIADKVMAQLRSVLRPGSTEAAVAAKLTELWRESAAQAMSFAPIVGCGANGAAPHHEPDDTVLTAGTTVIVDTGGRFHQYCSDMTRTFVLGPPSARVADVYNVVLTAHLTGIRTARPGCRLGDVDAAVRNVIVAAGYGKYFTHRTGHGVGIEIHEPPFVVGGNSQILEPGMVMSIEPGVYLPGEFGVRIEDLILIEADGARSLNEAPKRLEDIVLTV